MSIGDMKISDIKETDVIKGFLFMAKEGLCKREEILEKIDLVLSKIENLNARIEELNNVLAQMESELVVEGLIKGLGYDDCVISLTNSNVNVVIKSASLTDNEVAQIVSILKEQLNVGLENIIIMPVE